MEEMDAVYKLLTEHWKLPKPQLVISICGGNVAGKTEDYFDLFGKEETNEGNFYIFIGYILYIVSKLFM